MVRTRARVGIPIELRNWGLCCNDWRNEESFGSICTDDWDVLLGRWNEKRKRIRVGRGVLSGAAPDVPVVPGREPGAVEEGGI